MVQTIKHLDEHQRLFDSKVAENKNKIDHNSKLLHNLTIQNE
jgi:hypothetical protein